MIPSITDEALLFPRVSEVLSIIHDGLNDFQSTQRGRLIVDDKARIGNQVHDLISKTIKGEPFDIKDYMPDVENRYNAWKIWSDKNIQEYICNETIVWSVACKIRGTLDAVAVFKGKKNAVVVDWKNSSVMSRKTRIQTMFYEIMAVEMGIMEAQKQRYSIQIFEDDCKVHIYEDRASDYTAAMQLRSFYNFFKRS